MQRLFGEPLQVHPSSHALCKTHANRATSAHAWQRSAGCGVAVVAEIGQIAYDQPSILVLTAEFKEMLNVGEPAFRNAMLEMGVLTVLILVLAVLLFLLHRPHVGRSIARE
jgi:hypothetical protein